MIRSGWAVGIVLLGVGAAAQINSPERRPHAQPATQPVGVERVHYDSHCLTIDGQDKLIFSGAFHYFRCPKELWPDRFQKMKEAGFNTVETVVPWNYHERETPADLNDYSKLHLDDLRDWLKMACDDYGLYVIIRPGPYICAEWQMGGYPRWLFNKRSTGNDRWFRSDDPTYLAWSKHWYDAVCRVIVPQQVTHKPVGAKGVILFQIENEYDYWGDPAAVKENQLRALYHDAVEDGIDVPIFTCKTDQTRGSKDPILSHVFDAVNEYCYGNTLALAKDIAVLRAHQPNAPLMISELQGGWFSQLGSKLVEDPNSMGPAQIQSLTLAAWASGVRISNYYMLVGGTNFDGWNSPNVTTTYDYYAPIRECGGVGPKYAAVKALGQFVQECGEGLARADRVNCHVEPEKSGVDTTVWRAADGSHDLFFDFSQSPHSLTVRCDDGAIFIVHPNGTARWQVLYLPSGCTDSAAGKWYPEHVGLPARPSEIPSPIRIATAMVRSDPGGTHWMPLALDGQSLTSLNRFVPSFSEYRAILRPDDVQVKSGATLLIDTYSSDTPRVCVNGKLAPIVIDPSGNAGADLTGLLAAGDNPVTILYNDHGNPGFGHFGNPEGVRQIKLRSRPAIQAPVTQWRVRLIGKADDVHQWVQPQFDDSKWNTFHLTQQQLREAFDTDQPGAPAPSEPAIGTLFGKHATAVFRTSLELSPDMIQKPDLALLFQHVEGKCDIYINGSKSGEFKDNSRAWQVPLSKSVHPGTNLVAVVITGEGGRGGLTGEAFWVGGVAKPSTPISLELADQLTGDAQRWFDSGPTTDWRPIPLEYKREIPRQQIVPQNVESTSPASNGPCSNSLLTWYRCDFSLPAAKVGGWIPWRARIAAEGDGYLYLNGHSLGRYWNIGPQREFYLPECWLRFGPGQINQLVLCLRPADAATKLSAVEVGPYREYSELRRTPGS